MRFLLLSALFTVGATLGWPQPPAGQAVKTFASSADVTALTAKAKADLKEGQMVVAEPILSLPPYRVNLEYRVGAAPASVHEKEAEMFYAIQGSGTLVTGGKLVNEKRTNAENLTGTGIEGGQSRAMSKGDYVIVPENTPHWFNSVDGSLVLMSIHVPRTAAVER